MLPRMKGSALRAGALIAASISLSLPLFGASAADDKMALDEVISRHLAAIGPAEARAAAKNQVVNGTVKVVNRTGRGGSTDGKAVIVSLSPRVRCTMMFDSSDYPSEQVSFDGQKMAVGVLPNGNRTPLGQVFQAQDMGVREGLICGVLSASWPLLRINEAQPKLEYRGVKKVDGRQLHEVNYRRGKGSNELRVMLYFDQTTYQHVRTTYRYELPSRVGTDITTPNDRAEAYVLLIEEFSDFRTVDGLTLPFAYKLQLNQTGNSRGYVSDWSMSVTSISHKEQLEDRHFKLSSELLIPALRGPGIYAAAE